MYRRINAMLRLRCAHVTFLHMWHDTGRVVRVVTPGGMQGNGNENFARNDAT